MEQKTENRNRNDYPPVNRKQKDTLFRMLFRDRRNLLSLYNALNHTHYTDPEELQIVTLENAVYMNMKNDLAFLLADALHLYEHQPTYNPNMPLRDLFYITKEISGMIDEKRLYSSSLVKLPTPRFVTFYNGTGEQPERQILRLSDAYQHRTEQPELELTVTMLNINPGRNRELLDACTVLKEYMQYVTKIRNYRKEKTLEEAVEQAVEECIWEDILKEFLLKNKKEAMEVCIFEYDEEATLQYIRQDEFQHGKMQGIAEERIHDLLEMLKEKGNVPQELKEKILAQKDPEILRQWFTEALHAETVEAFEKEIEKQRICANA